VTAQEPQARLRELREAGRKLRRRPARATLAALAQVLERWRDPASSWRRRLEAELPAATGFSPQNVREGLARGLARMGGEDLHALVRAELGDRLDGAGDLLITGFETTAVVLAGSIPQPSLASLIAPLVLRSPVAAKAAARDPVTPALFAASLAEVDPDLGHCIAALDFRSDDEAQLAALLEADCVVATGSDASIAALARRVLPPRRFVASGHRLSLGGLGPEALRGAALDAAAAGLALDAALWDQQGCLSPLAVYTVGADAAAPDRLAEALARALARLETSLPRGAIEAAAAASFAQECEGAELRAAAGHRVRLLGGPAERFAVVREEDAAPRPAPLYRFLRVHPAADADAFVAALGPLGPHLAGVALAGFGREEPELARALAELGASRLCRPGELQAPPLCWHHDNRPVLLPLARFTDRDLRPQAVECGR
jgi:hypothetical protein